MSLMFSTRAPHPFTRERGMTLIDTIVGSFLLLTVFMGIGGAFQLTVDVVQNNKASAGAIALANERLEYLRSLPYASLGTSGGIPSGLIPQNEILTFNAIKYTRHVYIGYVDDPKDGLGAADSNSIIEDYKEVHVDVSWKARGGLRKVTLVARFSPAGIETNVPGGTLQISVLNSQSQPVPNASVSIINTNTSPGINLTTYTDVAGTVTIIGAPASTGYATTVTKPGYSTAQTYAASAGNPNPNPGHLTVVNNQATAGTFVIDLLGNLIFETYTNVATTTWSDPFNDSNKIAFAANIIVSGGRARFDQTSTSTAYLDTAFITPPHLRAWGELSWSDVEPTDTTILYHILYNNSGTPTLVPDSDLPGNAAGFSTSPISLFNLSTTTYGGLRLHADMAMGSSGAATPSIDDWSLTYNSGPNSLSNLTFTVQGAKTIGSLNNGTLIYKYSQNQTSNSEGIASLQNMETDSYRATIDGSTGYDLSSVCNPQPNTLMPGTVLTVKLFTSPHSNNSLLVDVRSSAGVPLSGASVRLYGGPSNYFDGTVLTDECGQAFFADMQGGNGVGNSYNMSVSKTGYQMYTSPRINLSGATDESVVLNAN